MMRVSLVHSETYARRKLERPGTARTQHLCHSTGGLTKSWGQQIAASTGTERLAMLDTLNASPGSERAQG